MPNALRWLVLLALLVVGCGTPAPTPTPPSPTQPGAQPAPPAAPPGAAPGSPAVAVSPPPLAPSPSPSPSPSPPPRIAVRLGTSASLGGWVLAVAEDQGYVAAQNLTLDRVSADPGSEEIAKALDARDRDVGVVATDHLVQFGRNGQALVMIAGLVNKPTYSLVAARDLPDIMALKGKPVGLPGASAGAAAILKQILRGRNIQESEVRLITFPDPGVVGAAVANGTVGASLVEPLRSARLRATGFVWIGEATDVVKDYQAEGIVVRPDWARQNEDTLVRLLRATILAERWIATPANKSAAIESLSRTFELSLGEAGIIYDQYVEKVPVIPREGDIDQAGVRGVLDLLADISALPSPRPDPTRLTDTTLLQRAKGSLPR